MKRVLIVSPSFPPINAADEHRVRTSLPFYRDSGWEPYVLAVHPDSHGGLIEPSLLETVPADVDVTRTRAMPSVATRLVGVGNVALRAWPHLYRAGARLIRRRKIDLVYFSTTMFAAVPMGRLWKARFGTPYVIDMQDPWRTEARPGERGGLKARAARTLHRVLEPVAMRRVDAITSVSADYNDALCARYPWVRPDMCAVIPFGASDEDMDVAGRQPWQNPFFDTADGRIHGVSVGRGGRDLHIAAGILFQACGLRKESEPSVPDLRLWFIGTDYASDSRKQTLAPIADSYGLNDTVTESPARLPYLSALRLMSDAQFVVILGSDEAAYNPSKIGTVLLTRRPFLAVLHEKSPAVSVLRQAGAGIVITFNDKRDVTPAAAELAARLPGFLLRLDQGVQVPQALMDAMSARAMTHRLCAVFDAALKQSAPQGVPCVE